MKSKVILLSLMFSIGFTFQNCGDGLDCDFGPAPDFFDITDMDVFHVTSENRVLESTTIPYEEYGTFTLSFLVDFVAHQETMPRFSLMNSAYGCSPPEAGTLGSKEEAFENITIITLNDFNEDYSAQDTINDLVMVVDEFSKESQPLNDFLEQNMDNVSSPRLDLTFASMPYLNQEFQVSVRVDLSTGERFDAISDVVIFE